MMRAAVSISLKIPDNTAYTALVALRKLGVDVERVERSEVYFFEEEGDSGSLLRKIEADERIFNPNKHRLRLLEQTIPAPGEIWIESLDEARGSVVAWRLLAEGGRNAERAVLDAAVESLLCNPAIERALIADANGNRDNARATE